MPNDLDRRYRDVVEEYPMLEADATIPTATVIERNLRSIVESTPPKLIRALTDDERTLWLGKRQCLIMELGQIEDYLGMERSIVPKRKREQERRGA